MGQYNISYIKENILLHMTEVENGKRVTAVDSIFVNKVPEIRTKTSHSLHDT